jgi:hypothetical protein
VGVWLVEDGCAVGGELVCLVEEGLVEDWCVVDGG